MFDGQPASGPGKAALHFVNHQDDAVLVADPPQGLQETRRRDVKAALALYRLDHHGGDPGRIDVAAQQALQPGQRGGFADAVQRVGIRRVVDLGRKRPEAELVRCDLAGQAQRHVGAAVIAAVKADHAGTARVGPGDLDSVFHRLGTGSEKGGFPGVGTRHQRIEPLGHLDIQRIRHNLVAGVRKALHLRLDGSCDLRVQVTAVEDTDAAGKIDVAPALLVPQLGVAGAIGIKITQDRHPARRGLLAAFSQRGRHVLSPRRPARRNGTEGPDNVPPPHCDGPDLECRQLAAGSRTGCRILSCPGGTAPAGRTWPARAGQCFRQALLASDTVRRPSHDSRHGTAPTLR